MKLILLYVMLFLHSLFRPLFIRISGFMNEVRGYIYFGKRGIKVYSHVEIPNTGIVNIGSNVIVHSNVRFQYSPQSPIKIGDNVQIFDHSVIQSLGGGIVIGKNVTIGEYTTIQAQAGVIIEDDVLLASKIQIITNNHLYEDIHTPIKYQKNVSKPVVIKKGAWVGINSTILSGVTIGTNSVVGAGSVVNSNVPDYTVVGGVPAHILKRFNAQTNEWVKVNYGVK